MKRFKGLVAGPLILIVLGFVFFGQWGAIVALFVGAATIFFGGIVYAVDKLLGPMPLWQILLVSQLIPAANWLWNCMGRSCPNYTLYAALPLYLAAAFCGFIFWLFAARRS